MRRWLGRVDATGATVVRFRAFVAAFATLLYAVILFAPSEPVYAQATAPAASGNLANVVLEAVLEKTAQLGHSLDAVIQATGDKTLAAVVDATNGAQLDAVVDATINAMSDDALAIASAAGGTAAPWAAVLGSIGAGVGLMATPTALGDGTLTAWMLNGNGSINVSINPAYQAVPPLPTVPTTVSSFSPFSAGATYYQDSTSTYYGTSPQAVLEAFVSSFNSTYAPLINVRSRFGFALDEGCISNGNDHYTCTYDEYLSASPKGGTIKLEYTIRVAPIQSTSTPGCSTDSRNRFPWLPSFLDGKSKSKGRTEILLVLQVQKV